MQSIHLETSSAEAHCSSEAAVQECCIADHYLPTLNCSVFSATCPFLILIHPNINLKTICHEAATLASHLGQRHVVCTVNWVFGWSASVVHRAYLTMSQGIKRPFCLDAHRVTDLAAFAIQSFENEALTWLIMPQTSDFFFFSLSFFCQVHPPQKGQLSVIPTYFP